ncbi:putative uncharacterized protein DDB_G0277255 [Mycetomoellerius zeteki]|uniref:putative uncharacterized protein DDB_G0277255 n=1 Tax=Mycetomoellerius zeteki TaxID=64791 RepID=UPI00084E4733|nr:PREDICTED: putative uncharacterized protein DDB_G0277255 [Trachymyrmex zeteki]
MPRNEPRQAGKRPVKTLTPPEKVDAINRVHNGESKAAVARDIGVPESTLRGWCKSEQKIISQVTNIRGSGTSMPGTSMPGTSMPGTSMPGPSLAGPSLAGPSLAGYEHILTSSSDNSNSVGAISSSRSTPTAQAMMLGLGSSSSGVTEKAEEFEAGPSHKRIKIENSSASNMMSNNISSLARAPMANDTLINPYLYNMMDPTKALNFLNTFMKPSDTFLSFPAYSSPANLLTDGLLSGNNGTVTKMTIANMINQQQQQLQQQQQQLQQQQQQQQQANNTLINGNKRKHCAPGPSTMDIPKISLRTLNNRSPIAEKSSRSISQPNYEISMPSTSATRGSDSVIYVPQSKTSKNGKNLTNIIESLHHPYVPSPNSVKGVLFNTVNNNNNDDDMDNETARKNYPDVLPPGFNDTVENVKKLLEWLHHYGSPVCTMKQVGHIQRILTRLQDWVDKKSKTELPQRINGMS